jgi:serine/threonine-protein kinase
MAAVAADRELLFGLLALQNGLINQVQLLAAFQAWTLERSKGLADHLVALGHLSPARRPVVEAMAALHLEAHGGDVERSLAALPAGPSTRRSLAGLGDPDLAASLAGLAPAHDDLTQDRPSDATTARCGVTLAETDPDDGMTLASAGEVVLDGAASRYEFVAEIARGGMGAVLKARDPALGRDLALKILLDCHRERTDLVDRFVEEAQICGQLQHPGVVPVYELGTLGNRRPFFTMKLVKGRTLAELLEERTEPDLPRFLSIFEAVCQTVAYAHARGVIHRDLKPSNVMVGSFGEVQVMDWGLAKVLLRDGQAVREEREARTETVVATLRSQGNSELSQAGSVLGTPAYMAPEQARGEIDLVDRRADVFALGSILCEVLTGRPAFLGGSAREILAVASRGDTADALACLCSCGADPDLLALARDCLAVVPNDRPAAAGVVADRVSAYLAGVQERLREAELARAQADARAEEERKRRRLALALAATIVVAGGLAAAGWRYIELQRIERARQATDRVNLALREATRLRGLAQGAAIGDAAPWALAASAAEKARDLLEPGVEPGLRRQVEELAAGLGAEREQAEAAAAAERRDRRLLDTLAEIRSAEADDPDGWGTDAAYAEAFRAAGYDAAGQPAPEVADAIRARPPAVAVALAAAIDDWAAIRRGKTKDRAGSATLTALARAADPDAWRAGLRETLGLPDRASRLSALKTLADAAPFETLGPVSLDLLGRALSGSGDPAGAEAVLRRAQRRHPDDVWLSFDLAIVLENLARRAEAVRYYTAARALRPETAHQLAHALEKQGEGEEAVAVFENLVSLRPENGAHWVCLGVLRQGRGDRAGADVALGKAVAALREAIRLRTGDAEAHTHLGYALHTQGKPVEAIDAYREAIRLKPDLAQAHTNLVAALCSQGKLAEAVAECREAIRLRPDDARAHANLGFVLSSQGKLDEAVAACREAIRLEPVDAGARSSLGVALWSQGKLDEAIAEFREAIRLRPGDARAHSNLGGALVAHGKVDEAVAAHREAMRLNRDPNYPNIPANLSWALAITPGRPPGDYDEAVALARRAIAIAPKNGGSYNTLALAEYRCGRWDESIAAAERSMALQRGGIASDWFFQAMARARKVEMDRAAEWFDKAVAWTRKHAPKDAELLRFWSEAAALLGRPGPGSPDPHPLPDLPTDAFVR